LEQVHLQILRILQVQQATQIPTQTQIAYQFSIVWSVKTAHKYVHIALKITGYQQVFAINVHLVVLHVLQEECAQHACKDIA